MMHRSHKDEVRRFVLKALAALALFVLSVLLMRATWRMYERMAVSSEAQDQAEHELSGLQAQQHGASSTLEELRTERGKEAQIRQRFDLARPGEGQIDIIYETSTIKGTATSSESWFTRLVHALFVW